MARRVVVQTIIFFLLGSTVFEVCYIMLQQLPFRYLNSHDRPTLTKHAHICHIYAYMHQLSYAYMQDICAQVRRAHVRIYTRNYSRCYSGCRAHVAPVSHHWAWRESQRCRQQRRRFNRTPYTASLDTHRTEREFINYRVWVRNTYMYSNTYALHAISYAPAQSPYAHTYTALAHILY